MSLGTGAILSEVIARTRPGAIGLETMEQQLRSDPRADTAPITAMRHRLGGGLHQVSALVNRLVSTVQDRSGRSANTDRFTELDFNEQPRWATGSHPVLIAYLVYRGANVAMESYVNAVDRGSFLSFLLLPTFDANCK